MAPSNEPKERIDVYEDNYDAQGRKFLQKVQTALDTELDVIATDAQKTADTFWSLNKKCGLKAGKRTKATLEHAYELY